MKFYFLDFNMENDVPHITEVVPVTKATLRVNPLRNASYPPDEKEFDQIETDAELSEAKKEADLSDDIHRTAKYIKIALVSHDKKLLDNILEKKYKFHTLICKDGSNYLIDPNDRTNKVFVINMNIHQVNPEHAIDYSAMEQIYNLNSINNDEELIEAKNSADVVTEKEHLERMLFSSDNNLIKYAINRLDKLQDKTGQIELEKFYQSLLNPNSEANKKLQSFIIAHKDSYPPDEKILFTHSPYAMGIRISSREASPQRPIPTKLARIDGGGKELFIALSERAEIEAAAGKNIEISFMKLDGKLLEEELDTLDLYAREFGNFIARKLSIWKFDKTKIMTTIYTNPSE